ncbi:MAG: hypothetical protein FJ148_23375 [Deltaproteobacteria bacterium]|nr:hypothetical protein [Deltaproteobacteria bacterium]
MTRRTTPGLAYGTVVVLATLLSSLAHAAPSTTKVWISGTTLKLRDASTGGPSDADFKNCMVVKLKRDEGRAYIAECFGTVIAGPGCTAGSITEDVSAGNPEDLYLPDNEDFGAVCDTAAVEKIIINAGPGDDVVGVLLSHVPVKVIGGDGNDDIDIESLRWDGVAIPYFSTVTIKGGPGDDYLIGGRGDDRIMGGRGRDWIEGACGSDMLFGGKQPDYFISQDRDWGCRPAIDHVDCGNAEDGLMADPIDVLVHCE